MSPLFLNFSYTSLPIHFSRLFLHFLKKSRGARALLHWNLSMHENSPVQRQETDS